MPQIDLTEEEIHQIIALCDISRRHNMALWRNGPEGPFVGFIDSVEQWEAMRLKSAQFMQGLAEKLCTYVSWESNNADK